MKNVAFKMVGHVLVVVYNEKTPTAEDHQRCLEAYRKLDPSMARALVVTDGGAPTPTQRKEFGDVLEGREYWMAVCTDSVIVRGIVTAVSWFTRKTKAFSKAGVDDALNFLEIAPSLRERIEQAVLSLQDELKEG